MIEHNVFGKPKQSTEYSWKTGSVNTAGQAAATNLASVSGFTAIFTPFTNGRKPTKISVLASAATWLKINGGDVIALGVNGTFTAEDLVIESIGISTNGSASTVTVYLQ